MTLDNKTKGSRGDVPMWLARLIRPYIDRSTCSINRSTPSIDRYMYTGIIDTCTDCIARYLSGQRSQVLPLAHTNNWKKGV